MRVPQVDPSTINVRRNRPPEDLSVRELLELGFKGWQMPKLIEPREEWNKPPQRPNEDRIRANRAREKGNI